MTRGRLMFQPIKIQKCTQLKTGKFITVVQTVNLYFTKLLYTALWGNLSLVTKLGEEKWKSIVGKKIFSSEMKVFVVLCCSSNYAADVGWSTRRTAIKLGRGAHAPQRIHSSDCCWSPQLFTLAPLWGRRFLPYWVDFYYIWCDCPSGVR